MPEERLGEPAAVWMVGAKSVFARGDRVGPKIDRSCELSNILYNS